MERRTLVILGVLVAIVLLAFGVVIVVRGQRISTLENELAAEKAASSRSAADVDTDTPDADAGEAEAGDGDPAHSSDAPDEAEDGDAAPTSREFGFVHEVRFEGGATIVVVDYAQFLTGDEAAAAAALATGVPVLRSVSAAAGRRFTPL